MDTIPVSSDAVAEWIRRVPLMRIDKQIPTVETLVERLSCFWLPNETILYIAQTDRPLKIRIRELYYQILGERSRHTGGHWLKAISNLESLYIYYSVIENKQRDAENALLTQFHNAANKETDSDPYRVVMPFANRQAPAIEPNRKYYRKQHNISSQVV